MTLQQYLVEKRAEILNSENRIEVLGILREAKETLDRSQINKQNKIWFWEQLKKSIKEHDVLLKEAQAAAALNDLVAYALAAIEQFSKDVN